MYGHELCKRKAAVRDCWGRTGALVERGAIRAFRGKRGVPMSTSMSRTCSRNGGRSCNPWRVRSHLQCIGELDSSSPGVPSSPHAGPTDRREVVRYPSFVVLVPHGFHGNISTEVPSTIRFDRRSPRYRSRYGRSLLTLMRKGYLRAVLVGDRDR